MDHRSLSRRQLLAGTAAAGTSLLVPTVSGQSTTIPSDTIEYGDQFTDELTSMHSTTPFDAEDHYTEKYEFAGYGGDDISGRAGDDIHLLVRTKSSNVNPRVRLVDPDGAIVEETSGRVVSIDQTLESTGTYTVYVTTEYARSTGEFTLRFSNIVTDLETIEYGEYRGGTIERTDSTTTRYGQKESTVESVTFEGSYGDSIVLMLSEKYFSLRLRDPDGNVVWGTDEFQSDDAHYFLKPNIATTLQSSGTYTIDVVGWDEEDLPGTYFLEFVESPDKVSGLDPAPTTPTPGLETPTPEDPSTPTPDQSTPTQSPSAPTQSPSAPARSPRPRSTESASGPTTTQSGDSRLLTDDTIIGGLSGIIVSLVGISALNKLSSDDE